MVIKKGWNVKPWASEEAVAGAERIDMFFCHKAQSRTQTIYLTEQKKC